MTTHLAVHGAVLAQLNPNSADGLRDTGLGIILALAVVVLGFLLLKALGELRPGTMIGVLLAGAVVMGVASLPDVTTSALSGLYASLLGGSGQ